MAVRGRGWSTDGQSIRACGGEQDQRRLAGRHGWPNTKIGALLLAVEASGSESKTDGFGLITRGEIALGDRLRKRGGG